MLRKHSNATIRGNSQLVMGLVMSHRCLAPKPRSMLLLIMKWWIWDDRNGEWVTHISDHFHMWIKIVATDTGKS